MNRRHLIKCIFPVVLLLLFSQLVVSDSWQSLPVFHYLLEFAQTHVHCVGDAIQPSHALSSPSPPASIFPSFRVFPMSWLFASGGQSIEISASASFLPRNIQD